MHKRKITTVGVFCGSSVGGRHIYKEKAAAVGKLLAEQHLTLIYGAGNVGLMGIMADACLAAGGKVTGVITEKLRDAELAHAGITELFVVKSMPGRKEKIMQLSDAFIALPGGYGTYDELMEVLTLVQLDIMNKPAGLLNTEGYFDPFVKMIDHGVRERFIRPAHRNIFTIHEDETILLDLIKNLPEVHTRKWLNSFRHRQY